MAEQVAEALGSATTMTMLVVLAATLLAFALLKVWLSGSKGNTVLLVGPCDAGKTTLLHQLCDGSTHLGSVASMVPTEADGQLASEKAGGATSARPCSWSTSRATHVCGGRWSGMLGALRELCLWLTRWTSCRARLRPQSSCLRC